ncbi:MAG: 4'-phosphopantetheinyl transferase superfamily protein [Thermodesulfobacteriota bacterium]
MTKNTISASTYNGRLTDNQIHIWKVYTDYPSVEIESLYKNILSPNERERVDRLRFENDKKRFIISRGQLRKSLSHYLKVGPADIAFTYNKYGKPRINSEINLEKIKFNASHSKNLVVYAITQNTEIGIDLEYIREVSKADKIVSRYFGEEESKFYYSQPDDKKDLAFFTLWTRKEAYSKAKGMGIGLPGKKFDLNLASPTHNKVNKNREPEWSIIDIEIDSDYVAAVATERKDLEICHYNIDTSI